MRLWISKNSEVPIREQLVTQIVLGIVSNDLKIAERLPSTRDLARRYDIHANTVSSAYRELARRGWVEFRKGSGVYVRARNDETLEHGLALDQLIARFFRKLREILVAEISSVTKVKVTGAGPGDVDGALTGAAPLVLYGHMDQFADRIK